MSVEEWENILLWGVAMVCLSDVDINKRCRIVELKANELIMRRFLDIGLIQGASVEKVLIGPFGGINAYSVMGSVIAIRDKDLEGVLVEYE